jgi:copper chaperone
MMTTIKVKEMHCEKCVARITKAFEEEGLKFKVSLEDKTVTVEEDDVDTAKDILEDLGF